MRRRVIVSLGAAGLSVGIVAVASAADLPRPVPPARSSATIPWTWSGFYVGGHVGAALSITDIADPFGAPLFGDNVRSPGFIGGGQIGYNYQVGPTVFGLEADISKDVSDGTNTCFAVSGFTISSTCRVRPDLYATLTGRLGYAAGPALLYAKGGAAWTNGAVDVIFNVNARDRSASSSSFDATGWTVGGGIEYALAPAWSAKLEYDYLNFGDRNVATPYVAGNPFGLTAPVTSAAEQVHQVKLGLNYRLGADERAWPAGVPALPFKAPASVSVSGWEAEAGARTMYSWGRFQKDHNSTIGVGPDVSMGSRLTYNDLQTNSSELFGRIETPWNVFFKGYAGVGQTGRGNNNDEDSFFAVNNTVVPYTNSHSPKIDGGIAYAVADLGYDIIRTRDSKFGAFAGYFYFNQLMNRYNCVQIANPTGSCEPPEETPTPPNVVRFQELDTWQAMRVGLSSESMLTDRLKFSVDAAYLPYVSFSGLDNHFRNPIALFPASSNGGQGAQVEALLSYYLTDRFALGVGGRYWTMWTTNGRVGFFQDGQVPGSPRFYRAAVEQAGAFVQASYTFGPGGAHTNAADPQLFKAPVATAGNDWSGFYVGVEGGKDWGRSKHVNSGGFTPGHASDITPDFAVDGGVLGGTIGYNAQFGRLWLFGLEGDMSWTNADGSASNLAPAFNPASSSETREHWLSTARVRLGAVPADRWLAYVTGGVAWADVEAIAHHESGNAFSESQVRAGWTAGAGIEYAIDRNWSGKLEYLHVGLNNAPYLNDLRPLVTGVNRGGGVTLSDDIVRGGINYKLGWGN
jgi:opacity protein-like surface antigen